MKRLFCVFLFALLGLAPVVVYAQASESSITKQMQGLRPLPDAQRPAATIKLAGEISTLPAGLPKLKLAYSLSHLVTEGDQGHEALQAVGATLAGSLAESPQPAKNDVPPAPYLELASLVRYRGVSVDLKDPLLAKATEILASHDADVEKADFTLKDLSGKKTVTLSGLRGKVVVVNFWATWCPPCRKEMPNLDVIYTHFQAKGLEILSITDEDAFKVSSFIGMANYHPPVLLDSGRKVAKEFHVDGIPKTFVFDREGKLVGQSIDEMTQHQFLVLLAKAGMRD